MGELEEAHGQAQAVGPLEPVLRGDQCHSKKHQFTKQVPVTWKRMKASRDR